MKQLKRFLALVLVGVLALTVLTGCGGNGNFGAEAEKEILSAVNSLRTEENAPLTNDSELKAKCEDALKYVNADGTLPLGKARQQEDTRSADGKTRTLVAIGVETKGNYSFSQVTNANRNTLVDALAITPDELAAYAAKIRQDSDKDFYNKLSGFAVATRTINGKTYLAMAMKVSVTKK